MDQMKRLVHSSITEALMGVMEEADTLDQIVILYRRKITEEEVAEGKSEGLYGIVHNKELGLCDVNWLVDMFKGWLLGSFHGRPDMEEEEDV